MLLNSTAMQASRSACQPAEADHASIPVRSHDVALHIMKQTAEEREAMTRLDESAAGVIGGALVVFLGNLAQPCGVGACVLPAPTRFGCQQLFLLRRHMIGGWVRRTGLRRGDYMRTLMHSGNEQQVDRMCRQKQKYAEHRHRAGVHQAGNTSLSVRIVSLTCAHGSMKALTCELTRRRRRHMQQALAAAACRRRALAWRSTSHACRSNRLHPDQGYAVSSVNQLQAPAAEQNKRQVGESVNADTHGAAAQDRM